MSVQQPQPVDFLQGEHILKDANGGTWTFQNAALRVQIPGFEEASYADATIRNNEILLYRDVGDGYMERIQLRNGQGDIVFAELRVNETANDFKGLWELICPFMLRICHYNNNYP